MEAPGADSHFTPAAGVDAGNASLNMERSAQRCSVIAALDSALVSTPHRHRTTSFHLHKVGAVRLWDTGARQQRLSPQLLPPLCIQHGAAEAPAFSSGLTLVSGRLECRAALHAGMVQACQAARTASCVQAVSFNQPVYEVPDSDAEPSKELQAERGGR